MTDDQIIELVTTWQHRLGLDHWDVSIDFNEPPRPNSNASTWRSNDYDQATIYLDPKRHEWTDEDTNKYIVHELIHLHLRDIDQVVELLAETRTPKEVDDVIRQAYHHAAEGAVERLAIGIAALPAGKD